MYIRGMGRRTAFVPYSPIRQLSQDFRLAGLLLNQDLYEESQKFNSTHKIPYNGRKPSFYQRNQTDFNPQYLRKGVGNLRMTELMENDQDFADLLLPRTESIQRFLGPTFPLLPREHLSIMCGLSNIELEFPSPKPPFLALKNSLIIETDKLRNVGQSKIELELSLNTIFISQKYLSTSMAEIDYNIRLFGEYDVIIPEFMRKNLIYGSIFPFRGAMRDGPVHSPEHYDASREAILRRTSIGSFYTLLGILYVKFERELVERFITEKVVNGNLGLVNIAMETMR